jgi:hypothetical protein
MRLSMVTEIDPLCNGIREKKEKKRMVSRPRTAGGFSRRDIHGKVITVRDSNHEKRLGAVLGGSHLMT